MLNKAIINCPNCNSEEITFDGIKKYFCQSCNWEFYHNTAAAVAGILEYEGKILAVIRNREPGKGMLDFPGGFVDPMETAEHAIIREIKEELKTDISNLEFLCTAPNIYKYKGIEYSTCDIFFKAQLSSNEFMIDESEIGGIVWKTPEELNPEEFSFHSMKDAIKMLKEKK